MLKLIGEEPRSEITARSLVSLFYRGPIRDTAQVYFNFTDEAKWKRITVFSQFYGKQDSVNDYFTVEITTTDCSPGNIDALRNEFEQHALKTSLLKRPVEFLGHLITPNAYPVYRAGQLPEIEQEKNRLKEFGIDFVGRQGSFDYLISHFIAENARSLAGSMKQSLSKSQS